MAAPTKKKRRAALDFFGADAVEVCCHPSPQPPQPPTTTLNAIAHSQDRRRRRRRDHHHHKRSSPPLTPLPSPPAVTKTANDAPAAPGRKRANSGEQSAAKTTKKSKKEGKKKSKGGASSGDDDGGHHGGADDAKVEEGEEGVGGSSSVGKNKTAQTMDEETRAFRRRLGIKISGAGEGDAGCPPPMPTFDDLPFVNDEQGRRARRAVLAAVEDSVWKEPTAVQMQAVPALCTGRDVVASAPTGSGKTAAFVLPSLVRLANREFDSDANEGKGKKSKAKAKKGKKGAAAAAAEAVAEAGRSAGPRVLLLAPTRELAAQIHREASMLAAGSGARVQLLTKSRASTAGVLNGAGLLVSTTIITHPTPPTHPPTQPIKHSPTVLTLALTPGEHTDAPACCLAAKPSHPELGAAVGAG